MQFFSAFDIGNEIYTLVHAGGLILTGWISSCILHFWMNAS